MASYLKCKYVHLTLALFIAVNNISLSALFVSQQSDLASPDSCVLFHLLPPGDTAAVRG